MPSAGASSAGPWTRICRQALRSPPSPLALLERRPAPGSLIHHSDRGVQYACSDYTALLEAHDIQPSMSRIGNPYDNAKAESFMKTLKHEEIDGRSYRDADHARAAIGAFIEKVYNQAAPALRTRLSTPPPSRGRLAGGLPLICNSST